MMLVEAPTLISRLPLRSETALAADADTDTDADAETEVPPSEVVRDDCRDRDTGAETATGGGEKLLCELAS